MLLSGNIHIDADHLERPGNVIIDAPADAAMIEALRKGDQVLTQGGIIGKIHRVGDDGVLDIEIAEGVKVKVMKHTIVQVMNKTEPAAAA